MKDLKSELETNKWALLTGQKETAIIFNIGKESAVQKATYQGGIDTQHFIRVIGDNQVLTNLFNVGVVQTFEVTFKDQNVEFQNVQVPEAKFILEKR